MIVLLNLPVFGFAVLKKGFRYSAQTFAVMCGTSILIDLSALFLPVFSEDKLFSALIGGVLCGVGLGLIYSRGFATGGTDLLASLISDRLPTVSFGRLILLLDAFVVAVAAVGYRDWRSALYSAATVYFTGVFVDRLLSGETTGKTVVVISGEYERISRKIMQDLKRGVTLLEGERGYPRRRISLLLTVVRKHELHKLKEIVSDCDREALLIVSDHSIDG